MKQKKIIPLQVDLCRLGGALIMLVGVAGIVLMSVLLGQIILT
jgi:hypothetical protein